MITPGRRREPETASTPPPPGCERRARDGAIAVRIPAGTFIRGSEDASDEYPPQEVRVEAFLIDRTPVTVAQYRAFLEAIRREGPPDLPFLRDCFPEGKDHRPHGWGTRELDELCPTPEHPVVHVDWFDACAYAAWVEARLPTEAEWERAARGPAGGLRYPWGGEDPTPERAVFGRRSRGPEPVEARSAGASPEGVLDLAGNVWEWCLDRYDARAYDCPPPRTPSAPLGDPRARAVKRGGSWTNASESLRCSKRGSELPTCRRNNLGFRCARPG